MTTSELFDMIKTSVIRKIQKSNGLASFAHCRAKYEGWFKVELIDTLIKEGFNALPERQGTDIVLGDIGVELKTVNTSYTYDTVVKSIHPITDNVNGMIKDIIKLSESDYTDKFIVFIGFPNEHGNKYWQKHLSKCMRC